MKKHPHTYVYLCACAQRHKDTHTHTHTHECMHKHPLTHTLFRRVVEWNERLFLSKEVLLLVGLFSCDWSSPLGPQYLLLPRGRREESDFYFSHFSPRPYSQLTTLFPISLILSGLFYPLCGLFHQSISLCSVLLPACIYLRISLFLLGYRCLHLFDLK